jgi:glutamate carboxypeptidase
MPMRLSIDDFRPRTRDMVARLTRLAEIESPTTDKAAVDRLGSYLAGELTTLGALVTVHPQEKAGNHLEAQWGEGPGGLLVLCHMDTVHEMGTLAHFPVREADGRLHGPGVEDMKGGIVVFLEAVRWLREQRRMPARPITALITSDEEVGSNTSRPLIERLGRQADAVFCLEPALPDGALKTARKGTGSIDLVAHGRAAHAGSDHEKGRNAIEELAHQILAVQRLTDYTRGTTVNVGVVSGGTRPNVVPEEARAEVDLRLTSAAEADRLRAWAASVQPVLQGTSISAAISFDRPPMPRDATMATTFQKAQAIAREIGLPLSEGATGGGSDANFIAPLGVPVLDGLGVRGDGAHSNREAIEIDSLPERAALLAALVQAW